MIYLDYTATTPIDKEVLETYIRVQTDFFANIDSLHKLGQSSNYMLEKAKEEIKEIINIPNHRLVFTGSASEANNLAIQGIVKKYSHGKIITTKIEHSSVFEVYRQLENEGYTVKYLDVDKEGIINIEQLESYLDDKTILISVMWINNVVGSIQPINKILKLVNKYPKTKLHVDGVQGLCKIVPEFGFKNIDLITFSGHKIFGPKGIALLAFKNNIELKKLFHGSTVQYNIRPGTVNHPAAIALCKAIKKYYPDTKKRYLKVKEINKYLRHKIKEIPNAVINSGTEATPYILNVSFLGYNGETIVNQLSNYGIFVSSGSACSSKLKKPDRTVLNITGSKERALSTVRISLSHLTSFQDIDKLTEILTMEK